VGAKAERTELIELRRALAQLGPPEHTQVPYIDEVKG